MVSFKRLHPWLRLAVSVSFLAWLVRRVHWGDLASTLARADPALVAVSLLMGPLITALSVAKWRAFMDADSRRARFTTLLELYLVGHFFNFLLPSNMGGDVVRVYGLSRRAGGWKGALSSVFWERAAGVVVLLAFALGAAALEPSLARSGPAALSWALVAGVWLLMVAAASSRRLDRLWEAAGRLTRVGKRAASLHQALRPAMRGPASWTKALGLSVVFHLAMMLNVQVACLAFGVPLSAHVLFAAVPAAFIISTLPISLGGLGLQEWAYVFAFQAFGLPPALGLSVGLLLRIKSALIGAVGGLLYLRWNAREKAPGASAPPARETAQTLSR
ncbi:MAG: lysylphosphatidylglycerol synthase transmembrane domain-containing protein [Elusimicrobiota bacterium]